MTYALVILNCPHASE